MKKLVILSFILFSIFCIRLSYADVSKTTAPVIAHTGVMLGIQGGYAQNNIKDTVKTSTTLLIDKGNFYGGVNLGFEFAASKEVALGIESGLYYGSALSSVDAVKVNDLIMPVVGTARFILPVGLNFFAKAGIAYINLSASEEGYTYTINFDDHWSPIVAGGIGYQIKNINLFAQYSHIFRKEAKLYSTDAVTAGVEIKLPV